jgi:hypothetical protein
MADNSRYLATVTVKSVRPNFPLASGALIEVSATDGREELRLHYRDDIDQLQKQAGGLKWEDWVGTQWEYDFFNHKILKFVKGK